MQKQNQTGTGRIMVLRALAVTLAMAVVVGGAQVAHADKYDDQINALSAQNSASQGVLNGLETQAGSYQAVINQLQTQINAIQSQLASSQAQQSQLQQQIEADKQEITTKKASLAADVKTMYVDGQMSTIEELATSKNLSDYVDKEEYRTSVQNQLDAKIQEIAQLQAQLQAKKEKIDQLVESQKAQNAQLASDQGQQNQLLSYNEGQQSAYNQQIQSNSSQIGKLRQQQLAANARFIGGSSGGIPGGGTPCGGGYPSAWCNAPQDSIIDSWGMYNRECVSYTAFRVAASGRYMPYWGGRGNANQWPSNARAAGIPMDFGGGARSGDIAISTAGAFGHAMYVERVNGNGTVFVSQYNAALNGLYSTNTVSESGLYFIHF
ncbi:MAG TPA: CHAP domain-containing protein [Candidatus Saccharimonadales bacterium]|nr:CHAP domain-containing protein [Candidatus Saccharimonadales bacterium]